MRLKPHRYYRLFLLAGVIVSALAVGALPVRSHDQQQTTQARQQPPVPPAFMEDVFSKPVSLPTSEPVQAVQQEPVATDPPLATTAEVSHSHLPASEAEDLPDDFVLERPDNPNIIRIGDCVIAADSVEIFPEEAVAKGQRAFDSPLERTYIRPDGTCVSFLKHPDFPLPESIPDTLEVSPSQ